MDDFVDCLCVWKSVSNSALNQNTTNKEGNVLNRWLKIHKYSLVIEIGIGV